MSQASRGITLVKNLAVTGQFVTRQVLEDPISLGLNVVRKMPHRWGKTIAGALVKLPGAGTQALGHQLQGDKDFYAPAQALLCSDTRGFLQKRIAAEVAISYGAIDYTDPKFPAAVRARTAWDRGDLAAALKISAGSRHTKALSRKLEGEALALTPGWVALPDAAVLPTAHTEELSGRRVLHLLTNSLPHTQSGYTLRSHRLLGALLAAGLKVTALTRTGYPILIGNLFASNEDTVDGLTYRRIVPLRLGKTLPIRLQQSAQVMANALVKEPAILHTTTNYHNGVVAAGVAHALNLPWIYEVRGIMEETWVSRHKGEEAQQQAEASERFAKIRAKETELMQAADHVVTLSQTMKQLLVDRGVDAEKISLLPNAVSEELFEKNLTSLDARQQLGLPNEGFWVGTVSSIVGYEGFDSLLRAVALAREAGHDVRAMLAGDGVARPGLEKLAQDLNISEYVHFLGKLPGTQAPLAHQALDVFCVPRTNDRVCRSVTPLKPIEAMALRRPVIMSNIPPLAELVDNGITGATGILVKPENPQELADAIVTLFSSELLREELAHQGRAFARTRTWAHNAQTLEKIYAQVAREKRTA